MTLLWHAEKKGPMHKELRHKGPQTSLNNNAEIQVVWPHATSPVTAVFPSAIHNHWIFPTHLTWYITIQWTYTENGWTQVRLARLPDRLDPLPDLTWMVMNVPLPHTAKKLKWNGKNTLQCKQSVLTWDFPCWHFHHLPHHVTCPRSSINKNE